MRIEKLTRLDMDKESKQQLEPREPKIQLVVQRTPPYHIVRDFHTDA